MKKLITTIILFLSILNIWGTDEVKDLTIKIDDQFTFITNKKLTIEVEFIIPEGQNIYISPLNDKSFSYFTKFKITDEDNIFKITKIKNPKGEKKGDDYILKKKGSYFIEITNTKSILTDKINLFLEIDTQICNYKTNICYAPYKFKKKITLNVEKK